MKRSLLLCILLLLLTALSLTQSMAQVVIANTGETRIGGQLLFYFDMMQYGVGYISITNTGTSSVPLHIQLYGKDCRELFNFRIELSAGCTKIYDLRNFELSGGTLIDLAGSSGILTVTPVTPSPGLAAVPYNHLAGNSVHADLTSKNAFGMNAVTRLAVDGTGTPLADFAGTLDGTNGLFQTIRPSRLHHDAFFALDNLTDSRMIFITFTDIYTVNGYTISGAEADLRSLASTLDCNRLSLPQQTFSCFLDVALETFLGGTVGNFRTNPGNIEIDPTLQPGQSLFGISAQTLGTFNVQRYLWGK